MSTTDTDLSMLSIDTALAPTADRFRRCRRARAPRDGFSRGDRGDRGRVLDVNNFDAIRISLASPEAIRGPGRTARSPSRRRSTTERSSRSTAASSASASSVRPRTGSATAASTSASATPAPSATSAASRSPLQGAPRADGPHRAGRAGRAHLVRQGHAEPARAAARHLAAQPGAGALLRLLPRHRGR